MSNLRKMSTMRGTGIALLALALVAFGFGASAWASFLVPQTAYPGANFTKYAAPVPVFGPGTNGVDTPGIHPRLDGTQPLTIRYKETNNFSPFVQPPTPGAFVYPPGFPGTYIWGYELTGTKIGGGAFTSPVHWPGFTIEAQKGTPTHVTYFNDLGTPAFLQSYLTVDQTIHWADPLNQMGLFTPYTGPIPVVTHLHGAEVQSEFDGGPEQWFTPTGLRGPSYRTLAGAASNGAVYQYLNVQSACRRI